MAEIQRTSTGLSGEYFVAAELLRRGYNVGITMGNTKAIDILAERESDKISIQVKAIYKKKNICWTLTKDKIIQDDDFFYIFVNLNADRMGSPDYFIATGKEAFEKCKQYTTRGAVDLSTINNENFIERWDKLEKKSSMKCQA